MHRTISEPYYPDDLEAEILHMHLEIPIIFQRNWATFKKSILTHLLLAYDWSSLGDHFNGSLLRNIRSVRGIAESLEPPEERSEASNWDGIPSFAQIVRLWS